MSTEYVPVSWSNEPIGVEKLGQMATNDEALFQMKPSGVFKHNGVTRSRGTKILAGSSLFQPPNAYSTSNTVYFGNFFSAGCNPVVSPAVWSYPTRLINMSQSGIGGNRLPDHRGFVAYVFADASSGTRYNLTQPYSITYIAMGW